MEQHLTGGKLREEVAVGTATSTISDEFDNSENKLLTARLKWDRSVSPIDRFTQETREL